jgi:hypothetical protein
MDVPQFHAESEVATIKQVLEPQKEIPWAKQSKALATALGKRTGNNRGVMDYGHIINDKSK